MTGSSSYWCSDVHSSSSAKHLKPPLQVSWWSRSASQPWRMHRAASPTWFITSKNMSGHSNESSATFVAEDAKKKYEVLQSIVIGTIYPQKSSRSYGCPMDVHLTSSKKSQTALSSAQVSPFRQFDLDGMVFLHRMRGRSPSKMTVRHHSTREFIGWVENIG